MIIPKDSRQPVIQEMWTTDDYGRRYQVVDKRLLDDAEERITGVEAERDDLARRVMEVADALSVGLPGGALVGGRGLVIAARRLAEDRDRWKSDCEKARARWTSPWSHRERWVGESAEPIPFPRPYNDLHQIQVDYQRTIHCGTGGPSPAERQETYQKVFEAAMSLVYEVTHLRAQVADLDVATTETRGAYLTAARMLRRQDFSDECGGYEAEARWFENHAPTTETETGRVKCPVDHTDPEQIRRAAGVLEGIGADRGAANPESYWESATSLRRRAQRLAAGSRLVSKP
ncbi:hypothetical protein SEA_BOYNAMEDSUE_61 [Gordonia phage BoyNamedSue]|uniref:Uncharacterized protein n=1 Tax=Gordonia phage BoyNamedSue TaxID=2836009 RepID=A0A8F3IKN4_9CAUD|nr:hypothetical protein PP491_gp61 [Gordonia phage BoyNamedSue]QWY79522.1 hypothetical protein SEA_BOYNAMEDSUE_61 [Gordonia phage BoyNamedSue]QYW01087.1 hypothetical protein SEA_ALUME_61 [Gordonia phage AlumE]